MPHGPFPDRVDGNPFPAAHMNAVQDALENTYTIAEVDDAVANAGGGGSSIPSWKLVVANDAPASVKAAADYVCDGTDDHVQIQAALDALTGAGNGGTVLLSPGTFALGATVTQPSRIRVLGVGGYNTLGSNDGGTLLRRQASFTGDNPMWAFEVAWWGGELGWVTFDGNKSAVASGSGDNVVIDYAAEGSEVHHVLSVGARGDGFVVEGESTPANLRQCSAFGNAGWGFNLDGISRLVTLWNPSGDSNGAGLIRVNGPSVGAITSVVIHSPKGERNYTSPSSGNDPAIHIEDYVGPVTIVGGSLDGIATTGGTAGSVAIRRSGTAYGPVTLLGLRVAGYTSFVLKDDTAENADIPDDGNGYSHTVNGITAAGSFAAFGGGSGVTSGSAAMAEEIIAAGGGTETWIPVPNFAGYEQWVDVAFSVEMPAGLVWTAAPFLSGGTWYVYARFYNVTSAAVTRPAGTVYARVTAR